RGEVRQVSAADFATVPHPAPTVIAIQAEDNTNSVDSETGGRGVPNYLQSITISPDGQLAAVPSKKDNTFRGFTKDGRPLTFENTVRTTVSIINFGPSYGAPATDTLD